MNHRIFSGNYVMFQTWFNFVSIEFYNYKPNRISRFVELRTKFFPKRKTVRT